MLPSPLPAARSSWQEEFQSETVRKIQDLYKYDCLRANKSTMAWGVEARVPFLDKDFLNVAMAIDPAEKMIDKSKGEREREGGGLRAGWVAPPPRSPPVHVM